jgi:hypothetical protein
MEMDDEGFYMYIYVPDDVLEEPSATRYQKIKITLSERIGKNYE